MVVKHRRGIEKSTSLPAFSLVMAPYGAVRHCADRLSIRLRYMQITETRGTALAADERSTVDI